MTKVPRSGGKSLAQAPTLRARGQRWSGIEIPAGKDESALVQGNGLLSEGGGLRSPYPEGLDAQIKEKRETEAKQYGAADADVY